MFAYLRGLLAEKEFSYVILDCMGVGYEVSIPLSTYEKLPKAGEKAKLLIHFGMSEDGIRLYGFHTPEERDMFRLLLSVSKIGPKSALAALSGMSVRNWVEAIESGDARLIATVPGLGKKTAERVIIDLKDRVQQIKLPEGDSVVQRTEIVQEAESALEALGYKKPEISKAIKKVYEPAKYSDAEILIKDVIRFLYKK